MFSLFASMRNCLLQTALNFSPKTVPNQGEPELNLAYFVGDGAAGAEGADDAGTAAGALGAVGIA
jgi:hypothetical protein